MLATTYWHGSIRSWEVQISNNTKDLDKDQTLYSENIVGKTLWHYPKNNTGEAFNLTVEISVYSDVMIRYGMNIVVLQDFLVQ